MGLELGKTLKEVEPHFEIAFFQLYHFLLTYHNPLMNLIEMTSRKSTCPERKVCEVFLGIVRGKPTILSTATNGVPRSLLYLNKTSYHKWYCIHAEEWAAKYLKPKVTTWYTLPLISFCNLSPCYNCAKTVLSKVPIIAHVYREDYSDFTGVESLLDQGIPVYRCEGRRLVPIHPDISLKNEDAINPLLKRLSTWGDGNFQAPRLHKSDITAGVL